MVVINKKPAIMPHRKLFWAIMMIVCLLSISLIYNQISNYNYRSDYSKEFPPKLYVVSPVVRIVETMDACKELHIENNDTICLLRSNLNKEQTSFAENQYNKYYNFLINYYFAEANAIDDPSFEKGTWQNKADDCCIAEGHDLWLNRSSDSTSGRYSLLLGSKYGCACVSQQFKAFSNRYIYLLSFDYKGDAPQYCVWVAEDRKCMPLVELEPTAEWKREYRILNFTSNAKGAKLQFYSNATKNELKESYYDNVKVYVSRSNNPRFLKNLMDRELIRKQLILKQKEIIVDPANKVKGISLFVSIKKGWTIENAEKLGFKSFEDMDTYILKDGFDKYEISSGYHLTFYAYLLLLILLAIILFYSLSRLMSFRRGLIDFKKLRRLVKKIPKRISKPSAIREDKKGKPVKATAQKKKEEKGIFAEIIDFFAGE